MSNFANMNKGQLRQAMRDAGMPYAGLNNDGMRAALEAKFTEQLVEQQPVEPTPEPAPVVQEQPVVATEPVAAPATPEVPAAPVSAPVVPGSRHSSKGVKIEKDRPMQHGVKKPSAGTWCRKVWDYLDAQVAAGTAVAIKDVKAYAETQGWNINNASIEFYNWRKFNGIVGRSK